MLQQHIAEGIHQIEEASTQQFDVPGRPQVVFTPGHTHGHSSLYFRDRGVLIAGDAFVTLNPYTGATALRSLRARRPPTASKRSAHWTP